MAQINDKNQVSVCPKNATFWTESILTRVKLEFKTRASCVTCCYVVQ